VLRDHQAASPDPFLRKLVAQAFAARDYLLSSIPTTPDSQKMGL
jgi:hypothetical protein